VRILIFLDGEMLPKEALHGLRTLYYRVPICVQQHQGLPKVPDPIPTVSNLSQI